MLEGSPHRFARIGEGAPGEVALEPAQLPLAADRKLRLRAHLLRDAGDRGIAERLDERPAALRGDAVHLRCKNGLRADKAKAESAPRMEPARISGWGQIPWRVTS